jgi:tetratricopeptide (TPR) repeat protein
MASDHGNAGAAARARTLLDRGKELEAFDQREQALDLYGEVVQRFSAPLGDALQQELGIDPGLREAHAGIGCQPGVVDVETDQVVAWALLCLGLALGRLNRREVAVVAYDEVIARFGGTTHPLTVVRVVWAMYNKALALSHLGRREEAICAYDALIAAFAHATDRRVRPRVAWSLWEKSKLLGEVGRGAEVVEQYEKLVARHDETVDSTLSHQVAWSLAQIAKQRQQTGRHDDARRVYEDLTARFGSSDDEGVRLIVVQAFGMQAYALGVAGQEERSIIVYDDMMAHFRDTDQTLVRDVLADSRNRKADALERLDRPEEALAAYDDALMLLADSTEPELIRRRLDCLSRKAILLGRIDRKSEALVVFDNVAPAYESLSVRDRDEMLAQTVLALLRKNIFVCAVDPTRATDAVDELSHVLGDVSAAERPTAIPSEPLDAEAILALLTELLNGDCWVEFATTGDDPESLATMETKALALYRQTANWMMSDPEAWNTPAFGAVSMIRQFADGYALLAEHSASRANLSLPSSLLLKLAVEQFGIAEWAAEQGHPVTLSDPTELAEEFVQSENEHSQTWDPGLAAEFTASICHYDMLAALCDSPRGRTALHTPWLRRFATGRLNNARGIAGWAWQRQPDAAGLAVANIFIAQAYFVATHGTVSSSAGLFPRRDTLHKLLRQTDAYSWLEDRSIDLPQWLMPDDE